MKPTQMLLFLAPTILALPPQDDVFRLDLLARRAGVQDRCIDYACHSFTPAKMCSHHEREQMHYVCWDIIHGGTGMFKETNEPGKVLVDRVRKELRDLERWVHNEL